jgi:NADH:ubiquinone oxidoreductase subunit 6 (subunit J)
MIMMITMMMIMMLRMSASANESRFLEQRYVIMLRIMITMITMTVMAAVEYCCFPEQRFEHLSDNNDSNDDTMKKAMMPLIKVL